MAPAAYNKTTLFISACCGLLLFGIALLTLGSVSQGLQQNFKLDKLEANTKAPISACWVYLLELERWACRLC